MTSKWTSKAEALARLCLDARGNEAQRAVAEEKLTAILEKHPHTRHAPGVVRFLETRIAEPGLHGNSETADDAEQVRHIQEQWADFLDHIAYTTSSDAALHADPDGPHWREGPHGPEFTWRRGERMSTTRLTTICGPGRRLRLRRRLRKKRRPLVDG